MIALAIRACPKFFKLTHYLTPLTVDDERPRITVSERRLLAVGTENGSRCNVWPSDIKLDDRAKRKEFHDAIWAEKRKERADRQKRIKGRKKS